MMALLFDLGGHSVVSLRHVWNPQLLILVFPTLVDTTTIHIVALDWVSG